MIFSDRAQAGRMLADRLKTYAHRNDVTVLGIPRGGVPVAFEIAESLDVPLDIFVARKLGVPGEEELAFGAIASGGPCVLDRDVIRAIGITEIEIEATIAREREELERREHLYRGSRAPVDVGGRVVILVDDGIATGSSIQAAILALRQLKPALLVVAAPVAPPETCRRLESKADRVVCVETPHPFHAIGDFYGDFHQVTDREVADLLRRNWQETVPRIG
jgi:predicted phosphoribosyltransferase